MRRIDGAEARRLYEVERLSLKRIATILGASTWGVRQRLHADGVRIHRVGRPQNRKKVNRDR